MTYKPQWEEASERRLLAWTGAGEGGKELTDYVSAKILFEKSEHHCFKSALLSLASIGMTYYHRVGSYNGSGK